VHDHSVSLDTTESVDVLASGRTYYWRVSAGNLAGTSPWSGAWQFATAVLVGVGGDPAGLPQRFALTQGYPNPFNAATRIVYELPQTGDVSLKVYDVLGRHVRTLVSGQVPSGRHQVDWNASDDRGRRLGSGVYFIVLEMGDQRAKQRVLLLK
jgi:hypothetical protein